MIRTGCHLAKPADRDVREDGEGAHGDRMKPPSQQGGQLRNRGRDRARAAQKSGLCFEVFESQVAITALARPGMAPNPSTALFTTLLWPIFWAGLPVACATLSICLPPV